MNGSLIAALSGVGTAQLMKLPISYRKSGNWEWKRLFEAGGMPSSHSAGVSALATYIGMKRGFRTIDFALSAIFGMIVMYDAMGIRRHAGEIAIDVNQLKLQVEKLADQHPGIYHKVRDRKLKEMLGHLPLEVAGGLAVGIVVGAIHYLIDRFK